MDNGNTKTPSMHRRLGSATLSQLAFPGESNPNFPWEKSHWYNSVVKKKKKKERGEGLEISFSPGSRQHVSPDSDLALFFDCKL